MHAVLFIVFVGMWCEWVGGLWRCGLTLTEQLFGSLLTVRMVRSGAAGCCLFSVSMTLFM